MIHPVQHQAELLLMLFARLSEWQGKQSIQVNDHPLPLLTDPVSFGSDRWDANAAFESLKSFRLR